MALTDTNSSRVAIVRGEGQPSGAGNLDFVSIPATGFSLKETLTSAQSAALRDDGQMAGTRLVRGESAGDIPFEIAYGLYMDEIISGVLRAGTVYPVSPAAGDDDELENAQVPAYFYAEQKIEASTGFQYTRFQSCQINSLSLSMEANSLATATINVVGLESTNGTAELASSTYVTANLNDQMDTNSAGIVMTNQAGTPIPATIQSGTLLIDNQFRGQQAVGSFYNVGNAAGRFKVTLTASMYFESMELYNQFKANTGVKATFKYQDTGVLPAANSYEFHMDNMKVTSHGVDVGGADQDVIASVEFLGLPALTGTNKTCKVTRHTST